MPPPALTGGFVQPSEAHTLENIAENGQEGNSAALTDALAHGSMGLGNDPAPGIDGSTLEASSITAISDVDGPSEGCEETSKAAQDITLAGSKIAPTELDTAANLAGAEEILNSDSYGPTMFTQLYNPSPGAPLFTQDELAADDCRLERALERARHRKITREALHRFTGAALHSSRSLAAAVAAHERSDNMNLAPTKTMKELEVSAPE
jgi:hypothetical protein